MLRIMLIYFLGINPKPSVYFDLGKNYFLLLSKWNSLIQDFVSATRPRERVLGFFKSFLEL